MARSYTIWYLTRDRHFLLKRPDKPFTQHFSEKLDFIVPWGRPISHVSIPGDGIADGPACSRVAVVDLDVEAVALRPGVRLVGADRKSAYDVDVDAIEAEQRSEELWDALESDAFIATSCFATVMNTVQWFERYLGRPVVWAIAGEQLLLVPRAGEMQNAFYERESGSIQFFHWKVGDAKGAERTVYTALSHDIVAHEAAHAVLDGLQPDLYHATSPESLAIHESLADLAAIAQNIDALVLEASERNVDQMLELGEMAEEFGAAVRSDAEYLRGALNDRTLDPDDDTTDPLGYPNLADVSEPHVLSQVMTGAVYGAFARFYRRLKGGRFWKLWGAAEFFPVIVVEALNYVPPGELSFADLGRAMLVACEQSKGHAPQIFERYFEEAKGYGKPPLVAKADRREAAHALCDRFARMLGDELVKRHVVDGRADLDVAPPDLRLDKQTRAALAEGKAADFVAEHRALFGLPDGAPFTCEVEEAFIKRFHAPSRQQLLVRVRWDSEQPLADGADTVVVPIGATMVVDKTNGRVVSLLRTHVGERRNRYREEFLTEWGRRGVLVPEGRAVGYDGLPLRDVIVARRTTAGLRLSGSARALHIRGEEW